MAAGWSKKDGKVGRKAQEKGNRLTGWFATFRERVSQRIVDTFEEGGVSGWVGWFFWTFKNDGDFATEVFLVNHSVL